MFTYDLLTSGIWQLSTAILSDRGRVWVVDAGYFPRELDAVVERAQARGHVEAIAFTHGHWDHVAGWTRFPDVPVLGSASLAEAVATASPTAEKNLRELLDFDGRWYVERATPPAWPTAIEPFTEGHVRTLGDSEVRALALPGHSADGLALLAPSAGLLIVGDYLSPLEIPFVEDLEAYRATLRRLLDLLREVDVVIPGHGPVLDRRAARDIAEADLTYLDALASARSDGEARDVELPRAASVPGMREHHLENVAKALGAHVRTPSP